MRILSEVDWIFYPFESRTGTSFSRRILTALALPTTKCRQVSLGMSQDRGPDHQTVALHPNRGTEWQVRSDDVLRRELGWIRTRLDRTDQRRWR